MLSSYLIMVGGEQSSWMMGLPLLDPGERMQRGAAGGSVEASGGTTRSR